MDIDIDIDTSGEGPGRNRSAADIRHEHNLIRLWILADRLLMPSLQNCVVEKLEEVWGTLHESPLMPQNWLSYLYEHTTANSPLRHLVVDRAAYTIVSSSFLRSRHLFPAEFFFDVAVVLSKAVKPTRNGKYIMASDGRVEYLCDRKWRSYFVPEDV